MYYASPPCKKAYAILSRLYTALPALLASLPLSVRNMVHSSPHSRHLQLQPRVTRGRGGRWCFSRGPNKRLHCHTDWRRTPQGGWHLTPIVRHMRLHQMSRCQRRAETQFPSQDCRAHDPCQFAGVFPRRGGVRAADTEEVEHAGLCFEDGAPADRANFDARHRDGDLQIAAVAGGQVSMVREKGGEGRHGTGLLTSS